MQWFIEEHDRGRGGNQGIAAKDFISRLTAIGRIHTRRMLAGYGSLLRGLHNKGVSWTWWKLWTDSQTVLIEQSL
jgi:hypothetical protein